MTPGENRPLAALQHRWKSGRFAPNGAAIPEANEAPYRPLVRGGHLHTLLAYWLARWQRHSRARPRRLLLQDGDQLVLHQQGPRSWRPGHPVAVLLHGLAGCHQSSYMVRIARKLVVRAVRTYRVDLRGAGAGALLARGGYSCVCLPDVHAALQQVARWCPGSPIHLIGFSLGGNLALKCAASPPPGPVRLQSVVAVCPPVDTESSSRCLSRGWGRLYDRHFVRCLYRRLLWRKRRRSDVLMGQLEGKPRTLREFDARWTAPVWGFASVEAYYQAANSQGDLQQARVPTLVLAAQDDPLVPPEGFLAVRPSPQVTLRLVPGGGHLGFVARGADDPDRWWMDWRVLEWIEAHRPCAAPGGQASSMRELTPCLKPGGCDAD